MKFKYILFDLDGTLLRSGDGIINSVLYSFKKMNIEAEDREELRKFIGPPLIDSYRDFCGLDDENVERAVNFYREYYVDKGLHECSLYEGVEDTLKKLADRGYKLAVASSKPHKFVVEILEDFGIIKYFNYVKGADMDEGKLSKTDIIRLGIINMGCKDLTKALMVGDRNYDINGAKNLHIKSVGAIYGYGTKEELLSAGADYLIDSAEEILDIV